ncbi:hypothetical protein YPPY47_1772 [Yersinia pestis PY-47]|nr:hypothetical protein YpUG050454_2255 [Yersinia pestis biovar Antiqua str. UG05-0454]EIQ90791.1 hypothetical protein YPPY01_1618 [Yersinia pestis PY-01]EIQ91926.1 hypothetical protein YPPY02_1647 [Yersinia pestis PY-02]EIQ93162.1 hypothetical protein YPPY03_1729 [Yersinia pestis PY-03]EIR09076.1 hypothetical protein YPPY06_1690 [Yersinia pestis PY-06]EIR19863.1 hypothetical protein YPPY07_1587 [Yersinia pestis PY-07]EIR22742.1 hypothetical protein YPPY09_1711 [Yersinia pestis PY-09]EIR3471
MEITLSIGLFCRFFTSDPPASPDSFLFIANGWQRPQLALP